MIDRVLPFDAMTALVLEQEKFDTVICLDKEPQPCALAMALRARRKLGVGLNRHGKPVPLNRECETYFHLGLSDDLKFRGNVKSYPQLVYGALGWHYHGQRYELPLNESAADHMRLQLAGQGWRPSEPTVGIFVGAGRAFANKMWPAEHTTRVIRQIKAQAPQACIVLLGGNDERPTINRILYDLESGNELQGVIDSGTEHDERSFVALVDACDVVLAGDTMAMHVAIARGKRVVAFFGPTCEQEIDLFGQGEKLIAQVDCGPCYKRVCDKGNACVESISVDAAAAAVLRQLALCGETDGTIALPILATRRAG
jgi:heptosyltransferase-2